MAERRFKSISPQDVALWREVCKSITPLHETLVDTAPDLTQNALEEKIAIDLSQNALLPSPPVMRPRPEFRTSTSKQNATKHPQTNSLQMDSKLFHRMQQGRVAPQARLDLHGMTLAQAHGKLCQFIKSAYENDRRLVLVITGKGASSRKYMEANIDARGALRRQVPAWLRAAPISPFILQISEAHQRHGGSGAYYVYLRRYK